MVMPYGYGIRFRNAGKPASRRSNLKASTKNVNKLNLKSAKFKMNFFYAKMLKS